MVTEESGKPNAKGSLWPRGPQHAALEGLLLLGILNLLQNLLPSSLLWLCPLYPATSFSTSNRFCSCLSVSLHRSLLKSLTAPPPPLPLRGPGSQNPWGRSQAKMSAWQEGPLLIPTPFSSPCFKTSITIATFLLQCLPLQIPFSNQREAGPPVASKIGTPGSEASDNWLLALPA